MARKGLAFRHRKGDSVRYAAVPFVVGTYEFQLGNLDRELAGMFERYLNEAYLSKLSDNVVPMRTIPVNRSVDASSPVAPYQDARQIVRGHKKIAVADCLCRVQQGILDSGCDKPREVCLVFGSHADYYVENGMARYIDVDEALAILDRCDEAGLVNQPHNTVNPGGMCNCCGDCCGILRGLKQLPRPVEAVFNDYFAVVDPDTCDGCETCIERCQMEAVAIGEDGIAVIDLDRCIGCGLCVTACPPEALRLDRKPEEQCRKVPRSGQELMTMTAEVRGTSLIPLAVLRKNAGDD
jgi:NAD-dependent dihydropyrimidine dehydrogenase PreA subunit